MSDKKDIKYYTVDSLLDNIKKSIPNLLDKDYKINLSVYDISIKTTYVISDVINSNDKDYIDNTYTIVYDSNSYSSSINYPDCYYVSNYEDLVTMVDFMINNQDIFRTYSSSVDVEYHDYCFFDNIPDSSEEE